MVDIARIAGVSISTVSRALAGSAQVGEETRRTITEIARSQGYVVHPLASGLRLKKTQTIGVVIPLGHASGQLISDPFFLSMIGHLADELAARNQKMLLAKVAAPHLGWIDQMIQEQRTDGIIVVGQSNQHAALNSAARQYLPLVVWGGVLPDQKYCVVGSDNAKGGWLAAEHLLSQGRRRIAFLGDATLPEIGPRYEGYVQSHKDRGLAPDPALTATADFPAVTVAATVHRLLSGPNPPDAIFAVSDVIAIAAMRAVREHGLRVPEDVAVVGYDDMLVASQIHPTLTSVKQDLAVAAGLIVDLLFRRIEGERATAKPIAPELIVRQSSTIGG